MARDNNGADLLLAFLGGAAAGVAVGMLLAPRAGQETRKQIGSAVKGALDDGRAKADAALESGRDAIEQGRESAAKLPTALRAASDVFRSELKNATEGSNE